MHGREGGRTGHSDILEINILPEHSELVNILSLSAMYICIKCLNIESVDSF